MAFSLGGPGTHGSWTHIHIINLNIICGPLCQGPNRQHCHDSTAYIQRHLLGCPLSPLLYALVAEPLACALREFHSHRGIRFPGYNLIISAYADDTLLYVRDPATNVSPVLRDVVQFGGYSGLKVNWTKSIIFPLTSSTVPEELDFPLTWPMDSVRYLGIQIHTDPEVICTENYGKVISKLEDDISRWTCLSLSLLDRISIMKMVILL